LRNKSQTVDVSRFSCCITVLLNKIDWRWDYAMRFGYTRVSTDDQDTAAQVAALSSAKCDQIFREKASGGRWDRPELHRLLERLRQGRLDRTPEPIGEAMK
jgi:hypothetical protein